MSSINRPVQPLETDPVDLPLSTRYFEHVGLLKAVLALGLVALIVVGWILYHGKEFPYWEMRYQLTDSTGYQPPPTAHFALDSVPRVIPGQVGPIPETPLPAGNDASPPPAVTRLVNPLASDPGSVRRGARVFVENCMMCHGSDGSGDGPVGDSYIPTPADLTKHVPKHPDAVLFWIITNGIKSTPTPEASRYLPYQFMSFRRSLTERERWEIVSWLKARWGGRKVAGVDPAKAETDAIREDQIEATGGMRVVPEPGVHSIYHGSVDPPGAPAAPTGDDGL